LIISLLVISVCYGQSADGSQPYLPVEKDGKWGYMNQSGELVIKATFDEAAHFSDGWAKVKVGKQVFFIDASGSTVLKPQVSSIDSFSEGLAVASKGGSKKLGYVNKKGEFVIEPRFNFAYSFSEGKASVCKTKIGECGYINKDGKIVIKQSLDGARKFVNGLAPAKTGGFNGQWGYVDAKGKFVVEPQFEQAMPFSEGLAAVRTTIKKSKYVIEKNIWGYINREGKWIIEPKYESTQGFMGGLAPVQHPSGWKFIDKKGETAFSRIGNKRIGFAEPFQGNLARATTLGLQGVSYGAGEVQFIMQGVEWAYLNKSGKKVWPKPQDNAKPSAMDLPEGYEKFESEWTGSILTIAYPKGWTATDLNNTTGFIEGVSFIKNKKAAQKLYKAGNIEVATAGKVRLVTDDNIIINVAVQPKSASNITPEKFIDMMVGTVLNDAVEESVRTFTAAGKPAVVRSTVGKDLDGRNVTSFQLATKRHGRIISISAFMPAGPDEQVEGIIIKMLESLRVVTK